MFAHQHRCESCVSFLFSSCSTVICLWPGFPRYTWYTYSHTHTPPHSNVQNTVSITHPFLAEQDQPSQGYLLHSQHPPRPFWVNVLKEFQGQCLVRRGPQVRWRLPSPFLCPTECLISLHVVHSPEHFDRVQGLQLPWKHLLSPPHPKGCASPLGSGEEREKETPMDRDRRGKAIVGWWWGLMKG